MSLLSSLRTLTGKSSHIVVLAHPSGLRVGVVDKANSQGQTFLHSENVSEESFLGLIEQLHKQHGKALPQQVCVVTEEAMMAVVELPVSTDKPRPPAQMQELIRWEMEALIAEKDRLWTLDAILESRGLMTRAQRQAGNSDNPYANSAAAMMDRVRHAVNHDETQIQSLIQLQSEFLSLEQDNIFAWQGLASVEAETPSNHWLCFSIGREARQRWQQWCAKAKLQLTALLPHSGLSAFAHEGKHMVLDCSPCVCRLLNFSEQGLVEWAQCDVLSEAAAEQLQQRLNAYPGQQYVINDAASHDEHHDEHVETKAEASLEQTIAAARAFLYQQGHSKALPKLAVADPKPPLWKQGSYQKLAIAAAILTAIVVHQSQQQLNYFRGLEQLDRLDQEYRDGVQLNEQLRKLNAEANTQQARLLERQEILIELENRRAIISDVLLARQQSIPELLNTLAQSVNSQVLIEGIEESDEQQGYFTITGWAGSDTAAYQFFNHLDSALRPLHLAVTDDQLKKSLSPKPLAIYEYRLRLVPRPPSELDAELDDNNANS